MREYFEMNENERITYQSLWDVYKAVLTEKFILRNVYFQRKKDIK